ncbi:hypothetical protein FB45DRAFT_908550 [Roridomyces roridus]|uniref:DUF6593 domain-containing protein n=1 Tax=Roridomyces roridus TaxID=1738132 RepID=A0AAD7C2J6_9AGAR|nr:hypothetical protein FB45DRAFT_960225 [Roridomyces roridus]KAJ7637195.1 hypothetical protein FB45DRAFT_908550 [Roridomyces roridus]
MFSGSQITLVDPAPRIFLTFSRNSMLSTTIRRQPQGNLVYLVTTNMHATTTEVRDADTERPVARIVRKDFLPDTVSFSGGKTVRMNKWLKRAELPDEIPSSILEIDMGQCVLRAHPQYRLALYSPGMDNILAHWEPNTHPPTLILSPTVESSQSQILTAFLYLEQMMRIKEKNATTRASVYPGTKSQCVTTT